MKIFLDANVVIDYLVNRMPFADDAEAVVDVCLMDGNEGAWTGLSACNAVYIIGRSVGNHRAEQLVKAVAEFLRILPICPEVIKTNLGADHPDFEDSLQIAPQNDDSVVKNASIVDQSLFVLPLLHRMLLGSLRVRRCMPERRELRLLGEQVGPVIVVQFLPVALVGEFRVFEQEIDPLASIHVFKIKVVHSLFLVELFGIRYTKGGAVPNVRQILQRPYRVPGIWLRVRIHRTTGARCPS